MWACVGWDVCVCGRGISQCKVYLSVYVPDNYFKHLYMRTNIIYKDNVNVTRKQVNKSTSN